MYFMEYSEYCVAMRLKVINCVDNYVMELTTLIRILDRG